jgi:CBS domain-containing protein
MQVNQGMSEVVLTVGPDHSLDQVARVMTERKVGAAVVVDPEAQGPGIITERDVLRALGSGKSPADERVGDHLSSKITFAEPTCRTARRRR